MEYNQFCDLYELVLQIARSIMPYIFVFCILILIYQCLKVSANPKQSMFFWKHQSKTDFIITFVSFYLVFILMILFVLLPGVLDRSSFCLSN